MKNYQAPSRVPTESWLALCSGGRWDRNTSYSSFTGPCLARFLTPVLRQPLLAICLLLSLGHHGIASAQEKVPSAAAQPTATKSPTAKSSAAKFSPTQSPKTVRVAGIVLKWLRTDKAANFRRAEALIRQAAAGGARIVCTTESFLDGYAIDDKTIPLETFRALGEPIPGGKYYERLRALAKELGIHLIAGMLERDGQLLYNTAVVISPGGKLLNKYHKQKLGHEAVRISPGTQSSVVTTPYGRIGVMICADRTNPDIVRRFCARSADFLICPSGGMYGPKKNDPIVQTRSRETGKTILFVHPAEFLVTGPDGSIVTRTLLGDRLVIQAKDAGQEKDKQAIFYYDLPLSGQKSAALAAPRKEPNPAPPALADLLHRPILDPETPRRELQAYIEPRIPRFEPPPTLAAWQSQTRDIRRKMLERIIFRGKASEWRAGKTRVQWLDTLAGGPGYKIRKFRYEALPGFWIPALLYEPLKLTGKMPVFINPNGHHAGGKAMPYKQRRCINLARRGVLAFNLEFIGMGQLRSRDNRHNRLVQMDLGGTSGLAPFYLALERGLDVALAHPHADPDRVGVAGLSGGGWQTIFLAALDPRITLANPVAGYSSLFARIRKHRDVGDAEQIPSDMATVGDYTHLTALVAPRPLLLTYNAEDNCCFLPPDVLPELERTARPIYRLYGQEESFRTHINHDPGTHNFDRDNREALYRLLGDYFFSRDPGFDPADLPVSDDEIRSAEELVVPLPDENATLHSLASQLSRPLPISASLPSSRQAALNWQLANRQRLRKRIGLESYQVRAAKPLDSTTMGEVTHTPWRLSMNAGGKASDNPQWTVPIAVLEKPNLKSTVLLIGDQGYGALADQAQHYLEQNRRVVLVDLLGFGQSKGRKNEDSEILLIATVGGRPLGIQAAQLTAVARWADQQWAGQHGDNRPVAIAARGPRSGLIGLIAAAVSPDTISAIHWQQSWGSLKEFIEQNWTATDAPELCCFGLLREFDVPQFIALVAPRPVVLKDPQPKVRVQLRGLQSWYALLGQPFNPVP